MLKKNALFTLRADAASGLWREVAVPACFSFLQLHKLLQALFGWQGYHLHQFLLPEGRRIQMKDDEGCDPEEQEVFLYQELDLASRFRYRYDFGDDWLVRLHVLDLLDERPSPWCLAGEGSPPGEDTGGPPRYRPGPFDLQDANARLLRAFPARLRGTLPPPAPVLREDLPSLASYDLQRLNTRSQMAAALVEAGRPLTWGDLRITLENEGCSLPKGVESLRRAWKRDPLFREEDGHLHLCGPHLLRERLVQNSLFEARHARSAPQLPDGPFTLTELEDVKWPQDMQTPRALYLILAAHGGVLPWKDLVAEAERLRFPRAAEARPERNAAFLVDEQGMAHALPEHPEAARAVRKLRDHNNWFLQRDADKEALEAWLEPWLQPARELDKIIVWWPAGAATARWHGGAACQGPAEALRAAVRPAEVVIAPNPEELMARLGLPPDGRRYVDLGDVPRRLATTFGGRWRPEDMLAGACELYAYGRDHGYVVGAKGKLEYLSWNPGGEPDLLERLRAAADAKALVRLRLRGKAGRYWSEPERLDHCIVDGNHQSVWLKAGRSFDYADICELEVLEA